MYFPKVHITLDINRRNFMNMRKKGDSIESLGFSGTAEISDVAPKYTACGIKVLTKVAERVVSLSR